MRKFISVLLMAIISLSMFAQAPKTRDLSVSRDLTSTSLSAKANVEKFAARNQTQSQQPVHIAKSGIKSIAPAASAPARVAADATDVYYLRGGFNGWGTTAMLPDGNGGYAVTLESLSGYFKVDHYGDWADNWGGAHNNSVPVVVGEMYYDLVYNGGNLSFIDPQANYEDVTVTFYPAGPSLLVSGTSAGQVEYTSWTVCGMADIFGTADDAANTANDMTEQADGSWVLTKTNIHLDSGIQYTFKATANHAWGVCELPEGLSYYWFSVEQSGTYDLTFLMDADHTQMTYIATLVSADAAPAFQASITVNNITTTGAQVTIIPSDANLAYVWDAIELDFYNDICAGVYGTSNGVYNIVDYMNYLIARYLNGDAGGTVEDVVDRGTVSLALTTFSPNTACVVYALAVDMTTGLAYGDVVTQTFTTESLPMSDNVLTITFDSVNATVNIHATNNDPYFLWLETTTAYESYQTDYSDLSILTEVQEWIDALDGENLTSYAIYQGDLSFTLDEFFQMWYSRDADFDSYIAFAVPYSGAIVGSVAHAIFDYSNPSTPVVPDVYYLRGGFNDWGTTAMLPDGNGGYSVTLDSLSGTFKVDHYGDWADNWGYNYNDITPVVVGELYDNLASFGGDLYFTNPQAKYNNVTVTFYPATPALLVTGTPVSDTPVDPEYPQLYAFGTFETSYNYTFVELTMVEPNIYSANITVADQPYAGDFYITTTNDWSLLQTGSDYFYTPAGWRTLNASEPVRVYNDLYYIYSLTLDPGATYVLTVNMATQQVAVNVADNTIWSPVTSAALKQDLDNVAAAQRRGAAQSREDLAELETVAAKYQAKIDSCLQVVDALVAAYTQECAQGALTLETFNEWHTQLFQDFSAIYEAALNEECGELVYTLDAHDPATVTYNRYDYYSGAEITIHAHAGEWTWFTLPFSMDMADIQAPDNANWVIRTYDGWSRAYNFSNTWRTINKRDGFLSMGVGYILHCDPKYGQTGDTFDFVFRTDEPQYTLMYFTHLDDCGDENTLEDDKSWNLIGNCYADSLYLPAMYQENSLFSPVTVWNGNGYDAYTADDEYWMAPLQAFFVQKTDESDSRIITDGSMLRHYVAPDTLAAAIQVRRMADDRQVMNFTLSGNGYTDRARLVFNENAQVAYERTCDASKFMSEDVAQLYVVENGRRLAIDERPAEDGTATLGISIAENGQYTLALAGAIDGNLMLTDNLTGVTTNLALMPYTFNATAGENEGRFTISVQPVATGIGNLHAGAAAYIYTIDGKFVGNDLRSLSAGSYIIRCGESVQKFIKK